MELERVRQAAPSRRHRPRRDRLRRPRGGRRPRCLVAGTRGRAAGRIGTRGPAASAPFAELPAHTPVPPKQLSRASGLALFMLAAGKPDSAVGWLIVSREIAPSPRELGRVHRAWRPPIAPSRSRPSSAPSWHRSTQRSSVSARAQSEVLDDQAQAAKRVREPLPPPARDPGQRERRDRGHPAAGSIPLRGRRPKAAVEVWRGFRRTHG